MGLDLTKTVVDFLRDNTEQKFTAHQMAEWIFEEFPAECREKKTKSMSIKTDADLIRQIGAEIGSQRPTLQRRNPEIKTTEGRPRQYYWTIKSDQAEITEVEYVGANKDTDTSSGSLKEHDLYPLLSEYLWSELGIYSKRINEKRASNKQGPRGNKWLYPDLVGMEDLTTDWHQEIKDVVKEYASQKTKLWSFEVKIFLTAQMFGRHFFRPFRTRHGRISDILPVRRLRAQIP